MRELCGTAAEYLSCHTLPYEQEPSGQEIRFEGGLLNLFTPVADGLEQKYIYRPSA